MSVRGVDSSQSTSAVGSRPKTFFLRSSVIYSKSCGECDGLPPRFPLRYPTDETRVHVRFSHRHTCIFLPPALAARCAGKVMTSGRGIKGGGGWLWDGCLTFPSCPHCLLALGQGWWVGGGESSLQLRFCSASLLRWLNGARISKQAHW